MNGPIVVIGLKQLNKWIGQTYKRRHKMIKKHICTSDDDLDANHHDNTLAIYFISIRFTSPLCSFAIHAMKIYPLYQK